jgi:hypothetical protein
MEQNLAACDPVANGGLAPVQANREVICVNELSSAPAAVDNDERLNKVDDTRASGNPRPDSVPLMAAHDWGEPLDWNSLQPAATSSSTITSDDDWPAFDAHSDTAVSVKPADHAFPKAEW